MKRILLLIVFIMVTSCGTSDDGNPILPNVPVNLRISLNLEIDLEIPGNYITKPGGISGIAIYNLNNTTFYAFDLACPHLPVNQCAAMVIKDGLNMECTCDGSKFAMPLGGQPQNGTQYAARQYKVTRNGNVLRITNF